jgi:hypothetical protein
MITKRDKFLFAGGILLVIVLLIVNFFFYPKVKATKNVETSTQVPVYDEVASVEPLPNQGDVSLAPQVVVTFSSAVTENKIELKSFPAANFSVSMSKDREKATFFPKANLKPTTQYLLQLFIEGQPIYSWSITTSGKATTQVNLASIINNIKRQLPYVGDGFRISYDAATDQFFIFVEKSPYPTYRDKAIDWFKQNGLEDLSAVNINYVPVGGVH